MRIVLIVLGGIALLATGAGGYWAVQGREARHAAESLQTKMDDIQAKRTALEGQLAEVERREREADDENARLLKQRSASSVPPSTAVAEQVEPGDSAAPVSKEMVETRLKHARELTRSGNLAEALTELLWCYDEGAVRIAVMSGLRQNIIPTELMRLGQKYPPAVEALRERRDRLEKRVEAEGSDAIEAMHLASINQVLGDSARTLALFDKLPESDPRRGGLAVSIYTELVDARRYQDAARSRTYAEMLSQLETTANPPLPPDIPNREQFVAGLRAAMAGRTSMDIEVLVGAGDLESSRDLARRLIALDNSTQTRALIDQHVVRGGHSQPLLEEKSP